MAERPGPASGSATRASRLAFKRDIDRVYLWYMGGFLSFVLALAVLEQVGLPRRWIGSIFLLATIGLYAGIRHPPISI